MLFFSSILLSFVVSIASILEHVCVPGALAIVQCCTLNIMRRGPLYCVILLAMCSLFIQHTHYRNAQTEKKTHNGIGFEYKSRERTSQHRTLVFSCVGIFLFDCLLNDSACQSCERCVEAHNCIYAGQCI